MFNLYIKQAAEIFGVTHTREIYEKAIEVLPDEQARWNVVDEKSSLHCRFHGIFIYLPLNPELSQVQMQNINKTFYCKLSLVILLKL